MAALGLNLTVAQGITTGTAVAVALAPVWWAATRRFIGARAVLALVALAIPSGLLLAAHAAATHDVSSVVLRAHLLLVAGGFCAAAMIWWARTVLPLRTLALGYGFGLLLRLAVVPPNSENPWKYGLVYPAAILALGLLVRGRPRWAELAALVALGVTSTLNDSRSAFAVLALAAVIVLWQLRPRTMTRHASRAATIGLLAAVSSCVYLAGTALIVEGYFGEDTQARSLAQLDTSGSVLLGGRPEWGASLALMSHRPLGYGLGVQASLEDILVAKSGMAELNYDPNNGYVENYMFGNEIKLHSVVADLWSAFGIPGLLLAGTIMGLVTWSLATLVARREASGLVLYLGVLTLWNLLFGPIYSAMPSLALTLGLVLVARDRPTRAPRTADALEPA